MYRCTSSSCQIFRRESVCTAIQSVLKLMLALAFQMYRDVLGPTSEAELYDVSAGFLVRDDLHKAYDRHEWSWFCRVSMRTERGFSNIADEPAFITARATNIMSTTLHPKARQTGTSMASALTQRLAGTSSLKSTWMPSWPRGTTSRLF